MFLVLLVNSDSFPICLVKDYFKNIRHSYDFMEKKGLLLKYILCIATFLQHMSYKYEVVNLE